MAAPAVAIAITGAITTDGDAVNKNMDTIDGFRSYSTSDSYGDSQAVNGKVGGGSNEGSDGRLEPGLYQALLLGVWYTCWD